MRQGVFVLVDVGDDKNDDDDDAVIARIVFASSNEHNTVSARCKMCTSNPAGWLIPTSGTPVASYPNPVWHDYDLHVLPMVDSVAAQLNLRRNFQVVSADASGKILTWDTRTGGVVDSYSLEDPIHISHIQVRGRCPCAYTHGTAKTWRWCIGIGSHMASRKKVGSFERRVAGREARALRCMPGRHRDPPPQVHDGGGWGGGEAL